MKKGSPFVWAQKNHSPRIAHSEKPKKTKFRSDNWLSVVTCRMLVHLSVKSGQKNLPLLCDYQFGKMLHVACACVPTVLCPEPLLNGPRSAQQNWSRKLAQDEKSRKTDSMSKIWLSVLICRKSVPFSVVRPKKYAPVL